jgi:hypothetical protein
MKKVVIAAIVVQFLLVGFEYSSAQPKPNLGGKVTGLDMKVTYQQETVPTDPTKQTEGDKLVTVTSRIKPNATYNPVFYIRVDPLNGNFLEMDLYWNNPKTGVKILTTSCPSPPLISSKPKISITKPPAEITISFKGFGLCTFCPDGISGGTTCNGGHPAGFGILFVEGTIRTNTTTEIPKSVTITNGALDGVEFNYLGEDDWASPNCTLYPDFLACPAYMQGSFGVTLKPCPDTDPQCLQL